MCPTLYLYSVQQQTILLTKGKILHTDRLILVYVLVTMVSPPSKKQKITLAEVKLILLCLFRQLKLCLAKILTSPRQ